MFADELELTVVVEQRGHAELAAACSIKPGGLRNWCCES